MNIYAVVAKIDAYTPEDVLEYWDSFEGAVIAKNRISDKGFYKDSELSVVNIEINK